MVAESQTYRNKELEVLSEPSLDMKSHPVSKGFDFSCRLHVELPKMKALRDGCPLNCNMSHVTSVVFHLLARLV